MATFLPFSTGTGNFPLTSFEAKKWLEVNFPSRGKVINFPLRHTSSFFPNTSFPGKQAIPRERESDFQGKKFPQRENFHSEGKFAPFSLGGKILPPKMFRVVSWNASQIVSLVAHKRGHFSSFKITRAVRVIARQLRDKNCLEAIFARATSRCLFWPTGSTLITAIRLLFWASRCGISILGIVQGFPKGGFCEGGKSQ